MNRTTLWFFVALALLFNAIVIADLVYGHPPKGLTVTFLPVGQGDAIYIETPDGKDMLIDGGPDRSALRELPRVMGPFDREIDVLVATHLDKDHIAGLPGVFAGYNVHTYIESSVDGDSSFVEELDTAASAEPGIERVTATRGMRVHLGEEVYADILYPDRAVDSIETNTGSVIMRLVYGETEFLLSGDAPIAIEEYLVGLDGENLKSDVLKAGHHGSRTSTAESWIEAVDPTYIVVSAGKDNSYGHPHEEVVERVAQSGATLLTTVEGGAVTFHSDGTNLWIK